MTATVTAVVGDQAFEAARGVRGKEGEKLRNGPVFLSLHEIFNSRALSRE